LVSARIGRVTGHGIAFSLRKVLPALGPRGVRGMKFYIVGIFNRQGIGVGNGEAVPSLRTRCAVFPRRALQSVVSTSGLARQAMGLMHREQPKVSEEGIRPALMIA